MTPARILRTSGKSLDGRSEDISVGGLLVVVSAACEQDELVKVRFALPNSGKLVELSARAKWIRNTRGTEAVGLEFTAVPPDVLAAIEQYVAEMGGV